MIGKLEELVLLASLSAGEKALANEIFSRVEEGSRAVAFGAVYTTLTRLAAKGMLNEQPVVDSSNRRRRGFTITTEGRSALQEALSASATIGGWSLGGKDGALA